MPPDVLDEAVEVLEELPGEAALADAGRAHDADEAQAALARRGMEVVLQLAELLVTPDERRLERLRPTDPAALGDHADRPPRRYRADLALEDLVGGGLEDDRAGRRTLRGLADQHGRWRRHALQPAGRVDQVAGDHALVRGAQRDRRFSRQDAGPDLDARRQAADRVDELEARANRPFGVVFTGDRCAPERHDRIADELLDGAAVASDDLADGLEIARLELTDILRVTTLGEAREADQVSEEDAHQPALGRRLRGRRSAAHTDRGRDGARARGGHRRRTLGAELRGREVRGAAARADRGEWRGALHAEPRSRQVLGSRSSSRSTGHLPGPLRSTEHSDHPPPAERGGWSEARPRRPHRTTHGPTVPAALGTIVRWSGGARTPTFGVGLATSARRLGGACCRCVGSPSPLPWPPACCRSQLRRRRIRPVDPKRRCVRPSTTRTPSVTRVSGSDSRRAGA